jgi:RNA polymerase sigma factor (TIGR02999 family)
MARRATTAITQLIDAARAGDTAAVSRLWRAAHQEVRAIARAHLAREGPGCSLQTTELVNEVWLRLDGKGQLRWENRRHFFGAVANAIRQMLIDDARRDRALKRGGGVAPLALEDDLATPEVEQGMLLEIDEAVERFRGIDVLAAEIVKLRYFVGLSVGETAAALDVSPRTVNHKWRAARAWLHRELSKGSSSWRGKGKRE